jgi:hypothetical protein
MISDLECAKLCDALYNNPTFAWDDILEPQADEGICLGIKLIDGIRYVVDRGSETPQDWWRDFKSELFHTMPGFEELGDVALGFSEGMPDLFRNKLRPIIEQPWVAVGHSLGAARAQLSAGMGTVLGCPPLRCVGFGPPRVGMGDFTKAVTGIPFALYRNCAPPVPDPVAIVPTDPPFGRAAALIEFEEPPLPDDPWGPLSDHHIELYVAGLTKLAASAASA